MLIPLWISLLLLCAVIARADDFASIVYANNSLVQYVFTFICVIAKTDRPFP